LRVTRPVTPVTGPVGLSPGAPEGGPLTDAERQRRRRARQRAAAEIARREFELAPLRLQMAVEAERQMAAVEAALGDEQRGLPAAERLLEGSRALLLRLYGNPLLRLAEQEAMPTDELARRLVCDRLDAARLQHEARRELLDRLFGKAPQASRDGAAPAVVVNLVATPAIAAALEIEPAQEVNGEPSA